jgi:histidine triad (HIT) family protein
VGVAVGAGVVGEVLVGVWFEFGVSLGEHPKSKREATKAKTALLACCFMEEGCLFCSIAVGKIPASILAENKNAVAFHDIAPQAPTHILIIPRQHFANVVEMAQAPDTLADLIGLAGEVASMEGGVDFRLVFNTGAEAGQSVFHAHAHLLAGRPLRWPPG